MRINRKIFLIFIIIVIFICIAFYLLTFSPFLANFKPVINYRKDYVPFAHNVRTLFGLPDTDIYGYLKSPITVVNTFKNDPNGYKYLYTIIGRLIVIDTINKTMTLRASDGSDYVITTVLKKDAEDGWYYVNGMADSNTRAITFYFYPSDLRRSIEKDPEYLHEAQAYTIYWRDARTLYQITKSFKNNSLNSIGNDNMSVLFISR